ncbi:tyrosine-type recombinase/integrase (plasmid) [Sinorhizobium meliloti]
MKRSWTVRIEARGWDAAITLLLLLAAQTGLRVSEITALDRDSVILGQGAHVQCVGKGRKERSTPLTKVAQQALRYWLKGAHNARRNGSLPEYARWQAQRRRRAGAAEQICR